MADRKQGAGLSLGSSAAVHKAPWLMHMQCVNTVETHYNMQNCYSLKAVGVYFQVFNARHP